MRTVLALAALCLCGCGSSNTAVSSGSGISSECREIAGYLNPTITAEGMRKLVDKYGSQEAATKKLAECTNELKSAGL